MRRRTFAQVLGSLAIYSPAGAGPAAAEQSIETFDPVEIESWDGTTLVGRLFVPDSEGPHPAVVATHGYGGDRASAASVARPYAEDGYVALAYASRGFGDSGGESGFDGPKEVADTLTIIDRLASETVDGVELRIERADASGGPAVGMDGVSYGGGIQLNTAAAVDEWFEAADSVSRSALQKSLDTVSLDRNPLDAIVPRITWHDLLQAAAPNGVPKTVWDSFILAGGATGYEREEAPTTDGPDPRLFEFVAKALATNEVPPEAVSYFEKRSPDRARIADNGVPTLLIQGWPDNLLPPNQAVANLRAITDAGGEAAIAFYPAGHDVSFPFEPAPEGAVAEYLDALSLAWMDRHVRNDRSRWTRHEFAPVTFYQQQYPDVPDRHADGEFPAWRTADEWPPAALESTTLAFAAASDADQTVLANTVAPTSARGPTGSLFGGPGADAPVTTARFDFLARCPVDVAGTPRLRLEVTPLGDNPVIFAKAAIAGSEATETVVDEQVLPYRIRSFAGRRTEIEFDMVTFQRYLDAGQRLRILLSTTDNGYARSRRSGGLVVHHDSPEASTLTLPVESEADDPLVGETP